MNIAEQVIRAKQDLDDVYSAGQSSMVDESKLIPKVVSGSYISVDDVSEIPHSVGCKVESVNLLPYPYFHTSQETNGVTYTDNGDGTIAVNGTPTKTAAFLIVNYTAGKRKLLKAGTYTLSGNPLSGNLIIYLYETQETSTQYAYHYTKNNIPKTFTIDKDLYYGCYISPSTGVEVDNVTIKPMLNRGTTALPYTPYVKPEEVKVTRTGKNLLPYPHWYTTKIVNGITFTDNGDGTVTANGTATADAIYTVATYKVKKGITYTFSGCPARGGKTTYYLNPRGYNYDEGSGVKITPDYDFINEVEIVIKSGTTVSNLLFKPQWELGDKATDYESYNGQTLTPSADGTVEGMTSVSPYMNIFSDTEGVNIEVEYNKSWGMQTEYDRFWDYYQDNGRRGNYNQAFSGWGWYTDTFKPKYDMHPTSAVEMFRNWNFGRPQVSIKQLLDSAGITLDLSKATSLYGFANSSTEITEFGVIDVSSATTCYAMFNYATNLRKVEKLIITETTTQLLDAFAACRSLTDIIVEGCIAVSINLKDSPLTKASITNIINTLSSTATGQTLTLKLSAVNTAFETSSGAGDGSTSAEFAALVATKTNWTITMI